MDLFPFLCADSGRLTGIAGGFIGTSFVFVSDGRLMSSFCIDVKSFDFLDEEVL